MSAILDSEDLADALLELDDDDFDELMVAESKGEAPWFTDVVTTDLTCCERWVERLQAKSQGSMTQLSNLRVEEADEIDEATTLAEIPEIRRRFKSHRSRVNYFRSKIDVRLREAKACRSELRRELNEDLTRTKHRGWYAILVKLAESPTARSHIGLDEDQHAILDGLLEP